VQGAVHTGASRGRAASTTNTSTGVALTRDRPRQQGLSCRPGFRVSAPQALAGALRVCRRAAQRAPWGPFAPSRPPPECRVRRSRGATFAEHGTNPPDTTDYFNKWNNASATLAMAANGRVGAVRCHRLASRSGRGRSLAFASSRTRAYLRAHPSGGPLSCGMSKTHGPFSRVVSGCTMASATTVSRRQRPGLAVLHEYPECRQPDFLDLDGGSA
jgi:hypothetical protein